MYCIHLPEAGTDKAWRHQARSLLSSRIPPEEVLWSRGNAAEIDLFSETGPTPPTGSYRVPRTFLSLASDVIWHRDPERFARLYTLLWRLRTEPRLMSDRGDPALAGLHAMAKDVRRDKHKMTAFLRFRELDNVRGRRQFAAWFEPANFIMEPSAPFFANRFGDMDWTIFTPDLTARFRDGEIIFSNGQTKPELPEDAAEDLWRTYYQNTFNPARLKVRAMQSEMPRKYWKNLPEAQLISAMVASAQSRASQMGAAAPTLPPPRAARIRATPDQPTLEKGSRSDFATFEATLASCRMCSLHEAATQVVPGKGPIDAPLMVVGEQPGDQEDLLGRPFVGPAGQLFDEIARSVGIDRADTYVTNAVKHFKFKPRGKRRIHQRPNSGEVQRCKWWLDHEIRIINPKLIVALGATATGALTGCASDLRQRRGSIEYGTSELPILITFHPSYILRLSGDERRSAIARFRMDLAVASKETASSGTEIKQ